MTPAVVLVCCGGNDDGDDPFSCSVVVRLRLLQVMARKQAARERQLWEEAEREFRQKMTERAVMQDLGHTHTKAPTHAHGRTGTGAHGGVN
jgi:hypothetical protein